MQRLLEKLRNKPAETRKRYALGTSVTVSGVIFIMWLTVISFGSSGIEGSLQNSGISETQTASPLSAFSNNASSAFQELRDQLAGAEAVIGTTTDEVDDTEQGSSTQNNESPESYWDDNRTGEVNGVSISSQSESVQSNQNEEGESFTSRNYNPNQESDWFAQ